MTTEPSTETGGKTLPSPADFETYLRIAREQHVFAFRLGGDFAVQFGPDPGLSQGKPAEEASPKVAGGWKRTPDLDQDPELDTRWD